MKRFYRWFDHLPEPRRFFVFMFGIGLPVTGLIAFVPWIGLPLMLGLIGTRMWWVYRG